MITFVATVTDKGRGADAEAGADAGAGGGGGIGVGGEGGGSRGSRRSKPPSQTFDQSWVIIKYFLMVGKIRVMPGKTF